MQDEFWDLPDTVDEIDTERVHPRQHEEVANMTPYEFLRQRAEPMPPWLANFAAGDGFNRQNFFASRVVFYPGSGVDGQPVKLFGSTHSAHCFVYVDYGETERDLAVALEDPRVKFRGYNTLTRIRLAASDLVPRGWAPHVHRDEVGPDNYWFVADGFRPFGFLEVLQRDEQRDDQHGPARLAILFLGADGIAAYDALFCQERRDSTPFAVVLQDHGFGGGYDSFGRGGLLERIARRCGVLPRWLLVADNSLSWQGFFPVPGVDGDPGGMHGHDRYLFQSAEELDLEDEVEGTTRGRSNGAALECHESPMHELPTSLDWRDYDAFEWSRAKQVPLEPCERENIAAFAADVLDLGPDDRARTWGAASPPGRFAATVIRVFPDTDHRYREQMAARQIAHLGVKVFKTTNDGRREAQRVLGFHRAGGLSLPGLPNRHVQQSLDAGVRQDRGGRDRHYVVQQWVVGDTLEDLVRRKWTTAPPDLARIRLILEQFFAGAIIPLWGVGTVWWDVRDANYCWDDAASQLTLIDTDSLAAYADEIQRTPAVWEQRERGRATALKRMRQMTVRLVQACAVTSKRQAEQAVRAAWEQDLEPPLRMIGRDAARAEEQQQAAQDGLRRFLDKLDRLKQPTV